MGLQEFMTETYDKIDRLTVMKADKEEMFTRYEILEKEYSVNVREKEDEIANLVEDRYGEISLRVFVGKEHLVGVNPTRRDNFEIEHPLFVGKYANVEGVGLGERTTTSAVIKLKFLYISYSVIEGKEEMTLKYEVEGVANFSVIYLFPKFGELEFFSRMSGT